MRTRLYPCSAAVIILTCAAFLGARPACGQLDTADASIDTRLRADHSPRGALWRAAAVPGWGQLYNRQYFKLPVVWGGLLGIAGTALYVNHRYLLYRHSYFWTLREDPRLGFEVPAAWERDYLALIADLGLTPEEAEARGGRLTDLFKQNRDFLRRNRDLSYIGIGLFYGLAILDAYVSAHLLDFDVGEDLSLSIRPGPGRFAARLRLP